MLFSVEWGRIYPSVAKKSGKHGGIPTKKKGFFSKAQHKLLYGIYYSEGMCSGLFVLCVSVYVCAIRRERQVDRQKCVDFSIESEKLDDFVGRCRRDPLPNRMKWYIGDSSMLTVQFNSNITCLDICLIHLTAGWSSNNLCWHRMAFSDGLHFSPEI